jgi:hypothetical protein
VPLTPDEDMVDTFPLDRADQSVGKAVLLHRNGSSEPKMNEDRNDSPAYLLFLAAMTIAVLLIIGWFSLGPTSERKILRDCKTITLQSRGQNCRPSEDQSRD